RTQAHYFPCNFEWRPLHGLATSQRLRGCAFDADSPQMATIDIARIKIILVRGVDDGSFIRTQRNIFGLKFSRSQQRDGPTRRCDRVKMVPSVLFGRENDAI